MLQISLPRSSEYDRKPRSRVEQKTSALLVGSKMVRDRVQQITGFRIKNGLAHELVGQRDLLRERTSPLPAQAKAFRLLVNRSVTWADWDEELLALELLEIQK
jgi:hypothetical protein